MLEEIHGHTNSRAQQQCSHGDVAVVMTDQSKFEKSNIKKVKVENFEVKKWNCEMWFTAQETSSCLRGSAFIELNDPSVILNEH